MILKDQITTIFVQIDDFCKEFNAQIKKMKLEAVENILFENYERNFY